MREWVLEKPRKDLVRFLSKELGISEISARLLVNRGIVDPEEAERFLNPSLSSLYNPFLLKDMDRAVDRTIQAMDKGERILIYGDYDADGITSTALLLLFFDELKVKCCYYIPRREDEGYGINVDAVKCFHSLGVKLIISVDCGTTSFEGISFAREKGIDTIVLDHHEVQDRYPECFAFVNPKRKDSDYPFDGLAGVGVTFNFVMALRRRLRERGWQGLPNLKEFLDLVAIGTVADVVPLVDQNRVYVRHGLSIIGEGKRPGIRAIKEVSGVGDKVDTFHVSFQIVPRINAAGRIGNARDGVDLLVSPSYDEAVSIAKKLNDLNMERQQMEDRILREIKKIIGRNPSLTDGEAFVFAGEGWHVGVVGIVASRLVEEFGKPSIVLSVKDGKLRGSGRSVEGVDLHMVLSQCSHLLESYGGHKMAAGLSLDREKLEPFLDAFRVAVSNAMPDGGLKQKVFIDSALPLSSLGAEFVGKEYEKFSPFGPSNPKPVFMSDRVVVRKKEVFGRGNLKLSVEERGKRFEVTAFRWADADIPVPSRCKMAYSIGFGDYMGERYVRIELEDMRVL